MKLKQEVLSENQNSVFLTVVITADFRKQYQNCCMNIEGDEDLNAEITNAVKAAGDKAQYDARVKRLLSQKSILAHILVSTIDEFKGMDPKDVVPYIEGEPMIDIVPVEPGLTNAEKSGAAEESNAINQAEAEGIDTAGCINTARMDAAELNKVCKFDEAGQRVVGFNTENAEINEGLVRFDIIFYVRMKNGLSQIIVNIECQKDEPSTYEILNRAIFYVSRIVSSQKERDFTNTNYDGIKQVFSIWICMNMDYNCLSHIHLTKDELLKPHEWKGNLDLLNIVMIGITNEIPDHDEDYELHRLIATLLSSDLKEHEKLEIIEHEYNIPINTEIREEVRTMCNLSDGIEERAERRGELRGELRGERRGTEKAREEVILNMYENGFSMEQISLATKKCIDEIEQIIDEHELALV